MKTILQMTLAKYRPKIQYVGPCKPRGVCYHVTMRPEATEEDIYAAKEGIRAATGCTVLCYRTDHAGLPHLGVFTEL